jgi:LacI family transcriptional regulator
MDAIDAPDAAAEDAAPAPTKPARTSRKRSVTVGDVARHAGVSSAVVSYVVNSGPRPVAAATRDRVRESIRELGYRPNAAARALKRGSTSTIGLAVPNNTNPYFAELSRLVEMAAEARGYETIFVNASDDEERERRHLQKLLARRIDGLLLASAVSEPDLSEVADSGTPIVLLDRGAAYSGRGIRADAVGVDYRAASRTLVEHLLEHGHEEVAFVVGDERLSTSRARERGWRDALEGAGRRPGPVVRAAYSRDGGYDAGRRLLRGPAPRAIFASSDMQAIGVLRAVREAGLDVPGDIALVSFDGTIESEFTWPPLTAMRQPVERMAEKAVELLLGRGGTTGEFHAFDAELVVRASCGCGSR